MELRPYYDRSVNQSLAPIPNEFRLVSLRSNGTTTLLRQGSLPIPERISFATFRSLSILRLLTACGYHIRSRLSSLYILSTTVTSYCRDEVVFHSVTQWSMDGSTTLVVTACVNQFHFGSSEFTLFCDCAYCTMPK